MGYFRPAITRIIIAPATALAHQSASTASQDLIDELMSLKIEASPSSIIGTQEWQQLLLSRPVTGSKRRRIDRRPEHRRPE